MTTTSYPARLLRPDVCDRPETSVILPCLNQAETLASCLDEIWKVAGQHALSVELIVVDNGSTDESRSIAEAGGARVVGAAGQGYGNALIAGFQMAQGQFAIVGDANGSYDFNDIPQLLKQLRLGHELVVGNRFLGGIQKRAMPPLSRYLGNPVLSIIGRVLFNLPLRDFHCGLRGCSLQAARRWQLAEPGVEATSEMVIKASLHKASISEIPVSLRPDGRSRPPYLHSLRDGWRHLNLMCRYFMQPPIA